MWGNSFQVNFQSLPPHSHSQRHMSIYIFVSHDTAHGTVFVCIDFFATVVVTNCRETTCTLCNVHIAVSGSSSESWEERERINHTDERAELKNDAYTMCVKWRRKSKWSDTRVTVQEREREQKALSTRREATIGGTFCESKHGQCVNWMSAYIYIYFVISFKLIYTFHSVCVWGRERERESQHFVSHCISGYESSNKSDNFNPTCIYSGKWIWTTWSKVHVH